MDGFVVRKTVQTVQGETMQVSIEFKLADCWIGIYWESTNDSYEVTTNAYVCIVPCFPINIRWTREMTHTERLHALQKDLRRDMKFQVCCDDCGPINDEPHASIGLLKLLKNEKCRKCGSKLLTLRHAETGQRVTGPFTREQRGDLRAYDNDATNWTDAT